MDAFHALVALMVVALPLLVAWAVLAWRDRQARRHRPAGHHLHP